ncbi:MAG: 2-amino-4-hydroxy-6-hydroxymethyldihydropteridine diphosphokinase [Bacteroidaceae bacterium]|nr:2-amino-4-hydroxy-6-hydroxymethyldihydropteridine diphosphokinase [Bacteroidaceae bacterium]
MHKSVDIYIGLGSNKGNREQLIKEAIELLSVALGTPISLSSVIETEPWGFTSSSTFLNMVAHFATRIEPLELLDTTESIERQLGRTTKSVPGEEYKDRPIDIDILFYDQQVIDEARLTVPHPRLHERMFVLAPLEEICPTLMHPTLGKSIKELKRELEEGQRQ